MTKREGNVHAAVIFPAYTHEVNVTHIVVPQKGSTAMNVPSPITLQPGTPPTTAHRINRSLGILATSYVTLFLTGLFFVSGFVTNPSYPAANTAPTGIVAYFHLHPDLVRLNAFFSFGAALLLGIFAVSVASKLRFISAVGADIALFVGIVVAGDQIASHSVEWVLTWSGMTQNATLTQALFYLSYIFGGPGFSLPMGVFVGTVSMVARSSKLLPTWIAWSGMALLVIGVVSWFNVLLPATFPFPLLIPLTRFPAFAWLIIGGFLLPSTPAARTSGIAPEEG